MGWYDNAEFLINQSIQENDGYPLSLGCWFYLRLVQYEKSQILCSKCPTEQSQESRDGKWITIQLFFKEFPFSTRDCAGL